MTDGTSSKSPVVVCRALTKIFSEGKLEVRVLRGVDLELRRGERVAIVGISGSGKSTLLHILGGLSEPSGGQVLIDGIDINAVSQRERGLIRNAHLGFVYQFHHLLGEFTALENVAMPLFIRREDRVAAIDRARKMLERVGLGDRLHHKPGELSGGERQRTAIARAMVTEPSCIMADEPTGNLDERTAHRIHEILLDSGAHRDAGLIVVTHNLALARRADRVLRLENGMLVASG
ncbi:MAG: ATP-binding cassette domain-containing protein [Gammaproteobacteria bacterium]|nr:ATP-binding cassette domain-containing protein [Gammaproteobacteria bacterium]MYD77334.1 ATP-binding cassette domain-containing protein [Gammaproteobacteria bacterium]MYJ51100.1 ATP-binding cassette domain-containing protein [Gammaproteobacteria bacterium]